MRCCGERARLLDQPLGRAEAARGDHQPLEPEPLVGERHAVALRPDQVRRRHPHPLERHDRVLVPDGVRVRRGAHHADAGAGQVHEEHRVLAVVVAADQPGLEERVGGLVVRRHVPLLAVEQVVVAVAPRGGGEVGHVGAGELLGDGVALDGLAADRRLAATARAGTAWRPPAASRAASTCTTPARW